MSTQTEDLPQAPRCDEAVQTDWQPPFSVMNFIGDPAGMHHYTGLTNYANFKFVLQTLGPAVHSLNYFYGITPAIDIEEQFFLTLIKLRRHTTNFELSRQFGLTESGVSNVFITMVNFMACQWGEIEWWPSRQTVTEFAPRDFNAKYPSTRVIIDGTEIPIEKPKQPLAQQCTFSTYKNKNTVKVLVGCTPGGLISYVSEAYGGPTSDRQICERSPLVSMCEPGDSIMADKGFNVQDLFVGRDVRVNIPTFFKKKNRMSGACVIRDRKIASKRVHIERLIGLAKTFKILKCPLNNTESTLATQIIRVCFWLCNFRDCIVHKNA